MRKLSIEEMASVSGGFVSMGDVSIASGNGVGNGNHIEISDIANCNSILNGNLNGALNGTGVGNFSGNA